MKVIINRQPESCNEQTKQMATFFIEGRAYGIDVCKVQEVTLPMEITLMPSAPGFIKGLINLRGRISTAIGLRELFRLPSLEKTDKMTVVCRVGDELLSLLVDTIGDVVEVRESQFEATPRTVPLELRGLMDGVYKTDQTVLTVLNLEFIVEELNKRCA